MKIKNAYFTVEAALVLPLVLGAVLFAVYLLLFQYNRCLAEQDAGRLTVQGSVLNGEITKQKQRMQELLEECFWDKYVVWKMETVHVEKNEYACSTEFGGQLQFPVPGWNFWNEENVWRADAVYEYKCLHPAGFVRMCRKIAK